MRRRGVVASALALLLTGVVATVIAVSADGDGDEAGQSTARENIWLPLASSQLQRTEVAAARVGRHVYVAGGFEKRSGKSTAAVERYDVDADRWRRVRSMPAALNHPAATAWDGSVYVLGGYSSQGDLKGEVSSLYRYSPRTNRWRRLPSAPTKRGALALGAIRGKLYAAGGANASGALSRLEIYDIERRRWSRGPDMAFAREHLAGAVADGAFYALAGRAAGQGNFAFAERYLPAQRRWERLPSMKKPRGGIAAATVGRRVIVFGGEEAGGTIEDVEMYDPKLRRWTGLPDMRIPRHGLGGVARGSRVYAIEGGTKPGFFFSRANEALDIAPARIAGGP